MRHTVILFTVILQLLIPGISTAGDAAAGKIKSGLCESCHGPEGVSVGAMIPNLAGQKSGYLVKQLQAFRDGSRVEGMMNMIAKGLSDADIDNLAAYYSSLDVK